jgi:hypothetical protein
MFLKEKAGYPVLFRFDKLNTPFTMLSRSLC